jgi:hypothetical protein
MLDGLLVLRVLLVKTAVAFARPCFRLLLMKKKQLTLGEPTILEQRAEAWVRKTKREFSGEEINAVRTILLKALIVDGRITNVPLK